LWVGQAFCIKICVPLNTLKVLVIKELQL